MEDQDLIEWDPSPEDPILPLELSTAPENTCLDMPSSASSPGGASVDQEILALLQALSTSTDIEALILKLEETHRRDFQEVKAEVFTLADRVLSGEASFTALERQVASLERAGDQHRDTAVALQLHLEDVEDRGCRNNLRLRGIPESVDAKALDGRLQELFREVLEEPAAVIEVDRAHRALDPRAADPDRPQDVVCRLLRYAQKERIVRRAWEHSALVLDGAQVKILPDPSRAPLHHRAMLRPVLDLAKQQGFT